MIGCKVSQLWGQFSLDKLVNLTTGTNWNFTRPQGCDRYKYLGSPNQIQNQIRLVLLVLTDTKIRYHYGKMANFVSPNQVQLQIGLVILVRPDTCDDTSQPYPYPTIMCDRSGILGLKFSYLSTLQKKLSERRQNARLSTTTTAVNSPSFGDEMRSISL